MKSVKSNLKYCQVIFRPNKCVVGNQSLFNFNFGEGWGQEPLISGGKNIKGYFKQELLFVFDRIHINYQPKFVTVRFMDSNNQYHFDIIECHQK